MNKKELITKDNVKTMGETIAVACARNRCAMYYTERAKKLYDGLVRDVYHHNGDPARNYSDGYDLAMEAIAFLCEHIGKRLSDTTTVLKYGNPKEMTILKGCFFVVAQYITKQVTYDRKSVNIDAAQVREKTFKNKQKRFESFKNRSWRISRNGNSYTKIKDHVVVLYGKYGRWKYSIDNVFFNGQYASYEEVLAAAFEALDTIIN